MPRAFLSLAFLLLPIAAQASPPSYQLPNAILLDPDTTPRLACAPGRLCALALEPGEAVIQTAGADTSRWLLEVAAGPNPVLILKPTEPDLETDILVTTTQRTIILHASSRSDSPAGTLYRIAPQPSLTQQWAAPPQAPPACPALAPDSLHFAYTWDAKSRFPTRPLRILDDGMKTYIALAHPPGAPLPALFEISEETGDLTTVNYIPTAGAGYLVADHVIRHGVLRSGKKDLHFRRQN